jgi:hypothetical protein
MHSDEQARKTQRSFVPEEFVQEAGCKTLRMICFIVSLRWNVRFSSTLMSHIEPWLIPQLGYALR